ncbi:MAG: hypothetical protein IH914_10815 [candidate division Zixibacteria bacterium]|nr:hypothetical protein [candidate division Zixibacteria bacterium]
MGTRNAAIRGAENKAVKAQIRVTQEAIDERDTLSAVVREAALALSEAEDDAVRLSDELQDEINRELAIQTVRIDTPGPVVASGYSDKRGNHQTGPGENCRYAQFLPPFPPR